jgi:hypothetical protein
MKLPRRQFLYLAAGAAGCVALRLGANLSIAASAVDLSLPTSPNQIRHECTDERQCLHRSGISAFAKSVTAITDSHCISAMHVR